MAVERSEPRALVLRGVLVCTVVALIAWWARDLRWGIVWTSRGLLAAGLWSTLLYSVAGLSLGLVTGAALATARAYGPAGVRHVAVALIEIVRGMPQLMVIFWIFFALPEVTHEAPGAAVSAILALTLIAASYFAEDIRGGLLSVPKAQWEAGYSTGLGRAHVFLRIILPQAVRNMLPAMVVSSVTVVKVTTLIYVIGVIEFFRTVMLINNRVFAPFELYLTAGVVYFILSWSLTSLARRLDPRYELIG
jgi:polar amino acid transport system permease protein